jgi:hypothetical protein
MSGGHFDYRQGAIFDVADSIEGEIYGNRLTDPKTVAEFQTAVDLLRRAHIYAHRIDWLLSGDDGEETFHTRLAHDLARWGSAKKDTTNDPR